MPKGNFDVNNIKKVQKKFRAVSHPMRHAMINMLLESPKLNVTTIYTKLKL